MSANRLLKELDSCGVKLAANQGQLLIDSPKGVITDALRRELIESKAEILVLLTTNHLPEICPQCGGILRTGEQQNYFEAQCLADPLHYSEIKGKPGADRLWNDIALPHELKRQRQYEPKRKRQFHYALEDRMDLGELVTGFCEIGCGHQLEFRFLDGVGYGYCKKCRVDQTIE
jgi:hypothetical protein